MLYHVIQGQPSDAEARVVLWNCKDKQLCPLPPCSLLLIGKTSWLWTVAEGDRLLGIHAFSQSTLCAGAVPLCWCAGTWRWGILLCWELRVWGESSTEVHSEEQNEEPHWRITWLAANALISEYGMVLRPSLSRQGRVLSSAETNDICTGFNLLT